MRARRPSSRTRRELVDADDERLTSGKLVKLLCAECAAREMGTLIAIGGRPHRRGSAR